jgi:hypothetical protein
MWLTKLFYSSNAPFLIVFRYTSSPRISHGFRGETILRETRCEVSTFSSLSLSFSSLQNWYKLSTMFQFFKMARWRILSSHPRISYPTIVPSASHLLGLTFNLTSDQLQHLTFPQPLNISNKTSNLTHSRIRHDPNHKFISQQWPPRTQRSQALSFKNSARPSFSTRLPVLSQPTPQTQPQSLSANGWASPPNPAL